MRVRMRLRGEGRGGEVDGLDVMKMVMVVVVVVARSVMMLMGGAPPPFQFPPVHSSTQTINTLSG